MHAFDEFNARPASLANNSPRTHTSLNMKSPWCVVCDLNQFKISVSTAEFNGLSSETYGNGIPHLELKILAKI